MKLANCTATQSSFSTCSNKNIRTDQKPKNVATIPGVYTRSISKWTDKLAAGIGMRSALFDGKDLLYTNLAFKLLTIIKQMILNNKVYPGNNPWTGTLANLPKFT
jgi:hypothetical protein